jgi:hypothetical protein
MFDSIVHAAGVQGAIVERGKDSLNDHQSWVDFHAGQEVLATMEERIGKWAQESYIGWDELEIIAPWKIYDAAWQHFAYLRVWCAAIAKECHTFESQDHYDPADYKAAHRRGRTAEQYRDLLVRLMRRDMQPSRSRSRNRRRPQDQRDDLPLRPEPDGSWSR